MCVAYYAIYATLAVANMSTLVAGMQAKKGFPIRFLSFLTLSLPVTINKITTTVSNNIFKYILNARVTEYNHQVKSGLFHFTRQNQMKLNLHVSQNSLTNSA